MNKEVLAILGRADAGNMTDRLAADLEKMEEALAGCCKCSDSRMEQDLLRIVNSGGKRLRPILAWLGYMMGHSEADEKKHPIVPLMSAIELVHTASLIHDDIVDEADVRRSVPTIHATSGEQRAVQAGDCLLAQAAKLALIYKDIKPDRQFAFVAKGMCEAEFLQRSLAYKLGGSGIKSYFELIKKKTAAFIAAAVALGATAGGAKEDTVKALKNYGENIGIAFQIRDDVLDFMAKKDFGKKCGKDLEQGTFTLPVLLAVADAEGADGSQEIKRLKELFMSRKKSEEDIARLLEFVKGSSAIAKAQEKIEEYTREAISALAPLEAGGAKDMLEALAKALPVRST